MAMVGFLTIQTTNLNFLMLKNKTNKMSYTILLFNRLIMFLKNVCTMLL